MTMDPITIQDRLARLMEADQKVKIFISFELFFEGTIVNVSKDHVLLDVKESGDHLRDIIPINNIAAIRVDI